MNKFKKLAKSSNLKYSFRSCCWNCGRPGHIGSKCRFPRRLKCSICKKPNIKTKDCDCRAAILQGISTKEICEPLRYQQNPMKLVIDVTILADNFTAIVNPGNEKSSVNEAIVKYLRLANIEPNIDHSIDFDIRVNKKRFKINCLVHSDLEAPISLGCKDSVKIGINFCLDHIHKMNEINHENKHNFTVTIENELANNDENETHPKEDEGGEEILNIMWDDNENLE